MRPRHLQACVGLLRSVALHHFDPFLLFARIAASKGLIHGVDASASRGSRIGFGCRGVCHPEQGDLHVSYPNSIGWPCLRPRRLYPAVLPRCPFAAAAPGRALAGHDNSFPPALTRRRSSAGFVAGNGRRVRDAGHRAAKPVQAAEDQGQQAWKWRRQAKSIAAEAARPRPPPQARPSSQGLH